MSKPITPDASDDKVMTMLEHYQCPTPFHQVRAQLLGCIASPIENEWLMEIVDQLWDGTPPEFESPDDEEEFLEVLLVDFWNRLADHQEEHNPFHLVRLDVKPTRESIQHLAQVRLQELGGFIKGVFGNESSVDLPEKAAKALDILREIESFFASMLPMLKDLSKPASPSSLKELVSRCEDLTVIVDTEINHVVLACRQARDQSESLDEPRTLH